jgi:hypothetical protein
VCPLQSLFFAMSQLLFLFLVFFRSLFSSDENSSRILERELCWLKNGFGPIGVPDRRSGGVRVQGCFT